VTVKTSDGKEVFHTEKVHMPVPQRLGRGDQMGRGPYEKSGLIRDSAFAPLKTTVDEYDIPLYKEEKKDGKIVRTKLAEEFNIDVELWYLPHGEKDDPGNNFMFSKFTKKLTFTNPDYYPQAPKVKGK
jgi:hypothetical protein